MRKIGSPSLWGAVGNLLTTEGAFFLFFDLSVCMLSHADTSPYEGEAVIRL